MKKLGFLLVLAWGAAHAQGTPPINYDADQFLAQPLAQFNFNDAGTTLRESVTGALFTSGGAGTTQFRQSGFNRLASANYSALFAYNSKATAPNNTLGDFEWTQPRTWTFHVRNTNMLLGFFASSEIASKGPMGGNLSPADLTSKGWDVFISTLPSNNQTRACLLLSGSLSTGVSTGFMQCSTSGTNSGLQTNLVNGIDHEVKISYGGCGSPSCVTFMIDDEPYSSATNRGGASFGSVSIAIGGSGTGYANSTAFTSTGGGTSCVVIGSMQSTAGVPTGTTFTSNAGCTSAPTIVLTAPTGTGVTLTATPVVSSISTSSTSPLVIAGDVNDAIASQSPAVHNAAGIQIDEFAMYPTAIGNLASLPFQLFADAVSWSQYLPLTSSPMLLIHDNDGCADVDNGWAVATAIALHQNGQVRLLDLNNTITVTNDSQTYRSMLDQAGLNHVPMSVSTVSSIITSGFCNGIATYSGSVASQASYPTDVVAMRTALVNAPGQVVYSLGGSYASLNALLQSPADSISSLTGSQLAVAKISSVYVQSGFTGTTINGDANIGANFAAAQSVFNTLNSLGIPFYLTGSNAPITYGARLTRLPNDPFGLWLNRLFASTGIDSRPGWDTITILAPLIPSMFTQTQGTFTLAGTSSAWTLSFVPGAGTQFYQVFASAQASINAGQLINSITQANPVPAPKH